MAKVPILRDEYALLTESALQNLLVGRAFCDFDNRHHVMDRFEQHPFFVKTVKLLTLPRTTTIVSLEPLPCAFAELDVPAKEISMELSLRESLVTT